MPTEWGFTSGFKAPTRVRTCKKVYPKCQKQKSATPVQLKLHGKVGQFFLNVYRVFHHLQGTLANITEKVIRVLLICFHGRGMQ